MCSIIYFKSIMKNLFSFNNYIFKESSIFVYISQFKIYKLWNQIKKNEQTKILTYGLMQKEK